MKIVVSNVFGPLNLGDFELFKKLIDIVDKEGVTISAIARDPDLCKEHFDNISFFEQLGKSEHIFSRVVYLIFSLIFVLSPAMSKLVLPKSQFEGLLSLKDSDITVACPGGFLEDSSFSFYTHLVQLYLASVLSGKVILAPMSIGPARSRLNRFCLKFVLNKVEKIYVRELVSAQLCDSLKINYILSNDLAFELNENNDSLRSDRALFTIINWNFPTSDNPDEQLDNYIDALVRSASYLNSDYGLSIGVIQQVASDRPAIDMFVERLALMDIDVKVEGEGYTPEMIMNVISCSKIVVASRFHSAIFSLNMKTPVVPISYLPKTSGMLDLYDCSELYLDIVDLDYQSLKAKIDFLLINPDNYHCTISKLSCSLEYYREFESDSINGWA